MAIEDPLILLGAVVGILVGLSVVTLLYLERTKDKRIRKARRSKGLDSDNEAYNAVQSAKSISNIMKRKGRDTDEAEMKLERAEMALESNNYSKAKSLADEAKEKLQSTTTTTSTSPMSAAGTGGGEKRGQKEPGTTKKKAYTEDDLDVLDTNDSESEGESEKRKEFKEQKEKIRSLPDNYLESRFEIRQARSKLKESEGEANEEAKKTLKMAREAFESEDYSKALSLSIECKKKIGSEENEIIKAQEIGEQKEPDIPEEFDELETLGGSEEPQAQGVTKTKTKDTEETREEPEPVEEEIEVGETEEGMEEKLAELEELGESEVEEEVSVASERDLEEELDEEMREEREEEVGEVQEKLICPDCGNEGREGDKFCNKCGAELTLRLNCPGCGAEVQEEDRFCPKCGMELTPITYACPDCGAEIEREAQFCPQCGVEFE